MTLDGREKCPKKLVYRGLCTTTCGFVWICGQPAVA